jgi:hypothetical protein
MKEIKCTISYLSVTTFVIPFHYGSGAGTGTIINYDSGANFLAHCGSGFGSASQKVMFLVPLPVPQRLS